MDIISLPIKTMKTTDEGASSRYRMVNIAAHRARQIMEGEKPTIQTEYTKASTIALHEVLTSDLEILYGKNARLAQREEKRLREEMEIQAALAEREEDLASEIKKELNIFLGTSDKSGKREGEEKGE